MLKYSLCYHHREQVAEQTERETCRVSGPVIRLLSTRSSFLWENGPNLKFNWVECCYRSRAAVLLSLSLSVSQREMFFFLLSLSFSRQELLYMEIGCGTIEFMWRRMLKVLRMSHSFLLKHFLHVFQFLNNAHNVCCSVWCLWMKEHVFTTYCLLLF